MADCPRTRQLLPTALRGQLLRDMQHWPPRSITSALLLRAHAIENDVRAAVAIVNGSVFWLRPQGNRNNLLTALVHDLVDLCDHYAVPDVELHLNVFDEPAVPLGGEALPTPIFSFFQTRAAADLLVPTSYFRTLGFDRLLQRLQSPPPWDGRRNAALWRGTLFCGPNRFLVCSRAAVAHLSAQWASPLLDVKFTTYDPKHDPYTRADSPEDAAKVGLRPPKPLQVGSRVSMAEHAQWRYLVHLDGFTAASRLGSLLATGAAVLKQDSYFWEYAPPTSLGLCPPLLTARGATWQVLALGAHAATALSPVLGGRARRPQACTHK